MPPGPWVASWRALPIGDSRGEGLRWIMRRNCSLAPRQVLNAYLLISGISLAIAAGFAVSGATPVLLFAGLELVVLGIAFLIYARHASDHETIELRDDQMWIEHHFGGRVERSEFRPEWVRVEPAVGQGSLLEVSGAGRKALVGRYLRPEWRQHLAIELRSALRRYRLGSTPQTVFEPQ
jgi:uncharacterized membrane protein